MILDASVAVPLFIRNEFTEAAIACVNRRNLVAPAIMLSEVGNTLWKYALRDGIPVDDLVKAIAATRGLLDELVPDEILLPSAARLAVAHRHSVYDSLYLALALARGVGLATADRRLATIARSLSIETELIEPTL